MRLVALLAACCLVMWGCGDSGGGGDNTQNQNNMTCGNGVQDPGEECDNGSANSDTLPDACRTDCRAAHCGDSVADTDESCDSMAFKWWNCLDFFCTGGLLTCNQDCTISIDTCIGCENECGDGVALPLVEECDFEDLQGYSCVDFGCAAGYLTCGLDCRLDPSLCVGCPNTCGDSVVDPGEQCDGTNLRGMTCLDFCSGGLLRCDSRCAIDIGSCLGCPEICGNWRVDGNESCDGHDLDGLTCYDLGFYGGPLACNPDCTFDVSGCME